MSKTLTTVQVRAALDYDPETGVFVWKLATAHKIKVGAEAGQICKNGYRYIGLYTRQLLAHRVAWLYVYGEWPNGHIDHINRDPLDNRIVNLRVATRSQNMSNRTKQRNNKSGYKGVCWSDKESAWLAQIAVGNRNYTLGRFSTAEAAYAAYCNAAPRLHGDFARTA